MDDLSVEDIADQEPPMLTPRSRRRMVSRSPPRKAQDVKAVGIIVRKQELKDSENPSELLNELKKGLFIGDVEDEDDEVSENIVKSDTEDALPQESLGEYIQLAPE